MTVVALIFAGIAAALHILFFKLESIDWKKPKTWKTFGLESQADADTTASLAYNQGFYNLFLAIGAIIGIALFWAGAPDTAAQTAGRTLTLFTLGSMVAAALVLITSGGRYLRAALIQGTLPLIAFVLALFA